jgi:hypothetical protein
MIEPGHYTVYILIQGYQYSDDLVWMTVSRQLVYALSQICNLTSAVPDLSLSQSTRVTACVLNQQRDIYNNYYISQAVIRVIMHWHIVHISPIV